MKPSKLISLALTAIISTGSIAANLSSTIPLADEIAAPGETLFLSFAPLYEGVSYRVKCSIRNNNIYADSLSYIKMYPYSGSIGSVFIDNVEVAMHTINGFTSKGSSLSILSAKRTNSGIFIQNLDATDSITVYNCTAALNV